jgi:hypothetical protein
MRVSLTKPASAMNTVLGGFLSNPIANYPEFFGPGTVLGGPGGVDWMQTFPYAPPAITSATFLFLCTASVFFGLDEVKAPVPSPYNTKCGSEACEIDSCKPPKFLRLWAISVKNFCSAFATASKISGSKLPINSF